VSAARGEPRAAPALARPPCERRCSGVGRVEPRRRIMGLRFRAKRSASETARARDGRAGPRRRRARVTLRGSIDSRRRRYGAARRLRCIDTNRPRPAPERRQCAVRRTRRCQIALYSPRRGPTPRARVDATGSIPATPRPRRPWPAPQEGLRRPVAASTPRAAPVPARSESPSSV